MTSASTTPEISGAAATDPLQLIDVDHVRFYVGNAKQAAFFRLRHFVRIVNGSIDSVAVSISEPFGVGRNVDL